ncbi:MAG: GNAT family N-acetyltransferase [Anaerostipes sp.]|jgi:GNAT superfamily N-acetyltransferase|nr:GNAT family N-acetyltransferase [Anaerostipes sp.]
MDYIKAKRENAEAIYQLIKDTKDIDKGFVGILVDGNELIGTGSSNDNHITRVYVNPKYQKQGYGSFIMQTLENEIALSFNDVHLDASLPASHMYEKRGYVTKTHEEWNVENGVILVYEVMEKRLIGDKFV